MEEFYEPCHDNLQHDRRLDGDIPGYVVGTAANRTSSPIVCRGHYFP